MELQSGSFYIKTLSAVLAAVCSTALMAEMSGNSSVLDPSGSLVGTSENDIVAVWDGTLNTQADITNNTLRENMTIKNSGRPFQGLLWTPHDVHVFGPGSYSFETCLNDGSVNCQFPQPLVFTVGPDQLGAHMLLDWGSTRNIDVAVVWDIDGLFPAGPDAVWKLASVDGDGNGIPGVAMVDGPFSGFSWNFSLNIPPQSIGIDVKTGRHFDRIRQSSKHYVRMAIISRDALDATRVDPSTISVSDPTGRLAGTTSDYLCRDRDANHDGRMDLVCRIEMSMLDGTGSRVVQLNAETYEGLEVRGEDSVLIIP